MEIRIADKQDIDLMMSSRLEMLKEVNSLDADYRYSESFVEDAWLIDRGLNIGDVWPAE